MLEDFVERREKPKKRHFVSPLKVECSLGDLTVSLLFLTLNIDTVAAHSGHQLLSPSYVAGKDLDMYHAFNSSII